MERDWQKYYFWSSIVFVVFLVFCAQLFFVGFSNGHHGWVSSQGLSIIVRTNFDHHLVGAASEFIKEDGSLGYFYFNRYPLLFSILMKNILRAFEGDLPMYVFISRQLMNLIYLLTAWVSFLFIDLLLKDRIKSLAVVLFAMSGYFVLRYKTMVHFDQPALLGMILLLYSIGRYKLEGRTKYLYVIAALVPLFGRGYVSCFMLLTWFIVEVIFSIATDRSWRELLSFWKWPSFRSLMIGGTLAASILGYNIAIESKITGKKWNQTSIVVSAESRLGYKQNTLNAYNKDVAWGYFAKEQLIRFIIGLQPYSVMRLWKLKTENKIARYAYLSIQMLSMLLIVIFGVMSLRGVPKLTATQWSIIIISIGTSIFWMFKMRVLTAFHVYTMMYYLGPNFLFYGLVFSQFRTKYVVNIVLMIALLAFATSIFAERAFYRSLMEQTNHLTYDFQHIREKIEGTKQVIGVNVNNKDVKTNKHRYFFPHMPYLVSFMLHEHYVTDYNKKATYVISRDKKYNNKNLTPDNKEVFLFSLR